MEQNWQGNAIAENKLLVSGKQKESPKETYPRLFTSTPLFRVSVGIPLWPLSAICGLLHDILYFATGR